MSDPNYGYGSPAPPPPPPGVPGPGDAAPGSSSLPVVSLILGILSIVCGGFVLGIVAIITGAIGRKKSKVTGRGAGMSLAGIITGIIGSVISIVVIILLVTGGISLFNTVSNQVTIAQQLKSAATATEAYGVDHQSYEGLSTAALGSYNYVPSADVVVTAVSQDRGLSYCISGYLAGKPDGVIHVPAEANSSIQITINETRYSYSTGGCPPAS